MPEIKTCNGVKIAVYSNEDCTAATGRLPEDNFSKKDIFVMAPKNELSWGCDRPNMFDSIDEAVAHYANLDNGFTRYIKDYAIRRILWRELAGNKYGTSEKLPVWHAARFWQERSETYEWHFAAVAEKDNTMIAYYDTEDKARRDVRTICKPGRYLTKYFDNQLTAKQIAFYASWQTTGNIPSDNLPGSKAELQFATTPEDIEDVYLNGPESCMSHEPGAYASRPHHPVGVYGAGDLAVAYLREDERAHDKKVIARALVWPEKKVYGRTYPTPDYYRADGFESHEEASHVQRLLHNKLIAAGYSQVGYKEEDTFDGARIMRVSKGNRNYDGRKAAEGSEAIVIPYLDNCYGILDSDPDSGFVYMCSKRDRISAGSTSGLTVVKYAPYGVCSHCSTSIQSGSNAFTVYTCIGPHGGDRRSLYCRDCRDNYTFRCHGCADYFSTADVAAVTVGGHTYSASYARANFFISARSGEWCSSRAIRMHDSTLWSEQEATEHSYLCPVTGLRYPNDFPHHADHPEFSSAATAAQIATYLEVQRQRSAARHKMEAARGMSVNHFRGQDGTIRHSTLEDALRRIVEYNSVYDYNSALAAAAARLADAVSYTAFSSGDESSEAAD